MITGIFINLPISDVERSRHFFTELGFAIFEKYSGVDSICVEIAPNVKAMMSKTEKFQSFMEKEISNKSTSEVILSLECQSGEEVRTLTERAFTLGARKVNDFDDQGFMISWAFEDLDGHLWDIFWMNPDQPHNP